MTDIAANFLRLFIVLMMPLFISYNIFCQDIDSKIPMLNNHRFIFLDDTHSPFIESRLDFKIGISETGLFNSIALEFEDTILTGQDIRLNYVDLSLRYRQKIKDWISVYMNYEMTARVGTDARTIVLQGFNTLQSREFGWVLRIAEKKKYLLSADIRMINLKSTFINIPKFVKDLKNGDPNASIEQDIPALVFGGGLLFAYGFNESLGITVDAQLVYGETFKRGNDQFQYFVGGSIDYDFMPKSRVPIAVAFGSNINTITNLYSFDSSLLSTYNLKIIYSGSEEFEFGIETYNGFTPIDNKDRRESVTGFSFNISLFF